MIFDEAQVRKTITIMKPAEKLFEIRILVAKSNYSGYFRDPDTLISCLKRMPGEMNGIYITLNSIKDECYSREQRNAFVKNIKNTTSDTDIKCYDWLMVDIDPERASGTSSSHEEIELAKVKANEVYVYLKNNGFEEPIVAMSGNGVHLLYYIGLEANKENQKIVKDCLTVLSLFFSDDKIKVDTANFNPARICKLYGTMARKGADTPERPHRLSQIIKAPESPVQNRKALLEKLAGNLPQPEQPQKYNRYNPQQFDLVDWMGQHGISYRAEGYAGGTKYILEHCPFDSGHKEKDACIFQMSNGAIGFHCFHNSCSDKTWRDVRLFYEPDAYDGKDYFQEVRRPNYKNPNYVVEKVEKAKEVDGQPVFYTTEQIRLLKTPPEEFIKTGITMLDSKLRGLKKGFVTCLSGLRACGKSSLISQLTVEAADQGYRTALFSGELTAKNLLRWLLLQSAGKNYVVETQYDNYYRVSQGYDEVISKWLDEMVYVYNNYYGNDFTNIMEQIQKCVVEHKVDLIILDNMMALNISMLEHDKYQQQSKFVEYLEDFAKRNNVHILFVAHPRKSQGFLRLDDISGSNDIVNRVDNALILHRVNEDFKRLSKEMFKWKAENPLYYCSNVIEICKDRDGGVQDEFIPLYFEIGSKRLRNDLAEYKTYGWMENTDGFVTDFDDDIPFDVEEMGAVDNDSERNGNQASSSNDN
ncbi:hypothetical protein EAI28_15055 [Faecalicatena contorta]|uniref:DnaB-like helicase C-terminal domain-containing protein n=2 Tax=Faecalicatena contorta TaxID=39482 RepID=UPI00129D8126|nr:DnaB-like helicase C-terminal domain-containing protein [Faecalicatena contorta]MRM89651.1 hypothetical protein [Faecalicatena contorta]GKH33495.1 hypothetical protein CE91St64_29020 [Faecalicatena contorta]